MLKGAAGVAWTVPTVVALGTTAAAATSYQFSFDSLEPPLINAATTASLVATGKGPKGAEISLTINGTSAGKVNVGTDGIWSKTFVLAGDVPQGKDVEVKATLTTTYTLKYTKDTEAPVLTHGQISYSSGGQGGSVSGTMGVLNAPPQGTPDIKTVSFSWVTRPTNVTGSLTQNATTGAWTFTWATSSGNAKGKTIAVKIAQSDGAGNVTEVPLTWNVPA